MPVVSAVDLSQVEILPQKKELTREVYIETLQQMIDDGQPREFTPDGSETLRGLKVNLTRTAGNEFDVRLIMQETRAGTLVVQIDNTPEKPKKTRVPRAPRTNGTAALNLPEDEGEETEA